MWAAIRRWAKTVADAEDLARAICAEVRHQEQRRLKAFFAGQRAADLPGLPARKQRRP